MLVCFWTAVNYAHPNFFPFIPIDLTTFKKLSNLGIWVGLVAAPLHAASPADSIEQHIQHCIANRNIADNLGPGFQQNPEGEFLLAPANKDLRFAVLIYNIDILPDKAVFSAGLAFREPHSNQLIAFRADNVEFSKTNGIAKNATLYLLSQVSFSLGNAVTITFPGGKTNGNYATFECNAIKEFGIHGICKFNNQLLIPCTDSGQIMPNTSMKTEFNFKAQSWNNIIAQISIPPFQVKGFTDYVFKITGATLDLSESLNPIELQFPKAYFEQNILGNQPQIWEGFYLQKGSITFPKYFKQSDGKRLVAGVQNLFIDEFGFSGLMQLKNLLSFEKGKIAGWNISISEARFEFLFNTLQSASLKGDISLPVLPDTSRLQYMAKIGLNDNYIFMAGLNQNLTIPALRVAQLKLSKGSFVHAEINHGEINLVANLNGSLSIQSQNAETPFKLPGIDFQGLRISNKEPKLGIEYLALNTQNKNAALPIFPFR